MYTAKAIVAVYNNGVDRLALALSREESRLLYRNINVYEIFYTNELVEAEILFFELSLVVLADACRVYVLSGKAQRRKLGVLGRLYLEFGNDKGEFGQLRLSFFPY